MDCEAWPQVYSLQPNKINPEELCLKHLFENTYSATFNFRFPFSLKTYSSLRRLEAATTALPSIEAITHSLIGNRISIHLLPLTSQLLLPNHQGYISSAPCPPSGWSILPFPALKCSWSLLCGGVFHMADVTPRVFVLGRSVQFLPECSTDG